MSFDPFGEIIEAIDAGRLEEDEVTSELAALGGDREEYVLGAVQNWGEGLSLSDDETELLMNCIRSGGNIKAAILLIIYARWLEDQEAMWQTWLEYLVRAADGCKLHNNRTMMLLSLLLEWMATVIQRGILKNDWTWLELKGPVSGLVL